MTRMLKTVFSVFLFFLLLILPAIQVYAEQNPRELLNQYVSDLRNNPGDTALREKIIKLAHELKPAPAIPEEAERRQARGRAYLKRATDKSGFRKAVAEFQKAVDAAPWLAEGYFNLGVTQEKAGLYAEAMESFKLYLLAAPNAKDAKQVKNKIYGLEVEAEEAGGGPMVFVKGGCFQMGSLFNVYDRNEEPVGYNFWMEMTIDIRPVHEVCLDDFYIDVTEVTQKAYAEQAGRNPSKFKDCDNCPVEMVDWYDAKNYCDNVGKRLPTEAEWAYAARSGGKKENYAGTSGSFGEYVWYWDNSGNRTHFVGQKKPNGLGLYDMSGNVEEWVADWYDKNYYSKSPHNNPKGPSSGQYRVLRGGSYTANINSIPVSVRYTDFPDSRRSGNGFRCARTP